MADQEKKEQVPPEETPKTEKQKEPDTQQNVQTAEPSVQDTADQENPPNPADPLAEFQKKFDELQDRYLRLMAEYDNYRKRSVREREAIYPDAVAHTVKEFLPVAESFDRALAVHCLDEEYAKGMSMIQTSLQDALRRLKVEEFGKAGEPFDPAFHNAVMHTHDENIKAGVITQVLQKGYKIGDRVLRYAMVEVAN